VAKSMVVVERLDDRSSRYRLLETQAAFAAERLTAAHEASVIAKRHYNYFVEAVAARTSSAAGAMAGRRVGLVEATWKRREVGNLWAALQWARDNSSDRGFELAAFMTQIGDVELVALRAWLTDLLRQFPIDPTLPGHSSRGTIDRVWIFSAAFELAFRQADYEGALEFARATVAVTEALGSTLANSDPPDLARRYRNSTAMALVKVGHSLRALGQMGAAREAFVRALSLIDRDLGERPLAMVHASLGCLDLCEGRYEEAETMLNIALEVFEEEGSDVPAASVMESIANVKLAQGDVVSAAHRWMTSLSTARTFGDAALQLTCIGGLSRLASARNEYERALRLAAAHERLTKLWAEIDEPYWRDQLSNSVAVSRRELRPKEAQQAWEHGLRWDLDQAVDYALSMSHEMPPTELQITKREIEVVREVTKGATNKEIAGRLFMAERTVEGHLDRIRGKLGLRSRAEVAVWATAHGLAETAQMEKGPLIGVPSSRTSKPHKS